MTSRSRGADSGLADVPALIMGNGPSLARIDFRATGGFATFGMNAAYRYWREIDWWPDYYACLDLVVGESHRDEIASLISRADSLGIRRFLLRQPLIRRLGPAGRSPRVVCYEALLADGALPKLHDVTTGSHTLLWAEHLGYRAILLAGVDCNYVERVEGAASRGDHLEIERETANPNYFFPGYQRQGDRFNVPNRVPDMHVDSWRNAARALGPATRVLNLNPASRVDAFPRAAAVSLEAPPTEGQAPAPTPAAPWVPHPAELARLQTTLRRLRAYRAPASSEAILGFLRDVLDPAVDAAVAGWRQRIPAPITADHSGHTAAAPEALTVTIRGLGELTANPASPHPAPGQAVLLRLHDARRIDALNEVLWRLHETLGRVPWPRRIAAPLRTFARKAARRLPLRLRAMDHGALVRRLTGRSGGA